MNCKRNYKNTGQPLLFIKNQLAEKSRTNSLSRDILSKVAPKDVNGGDSTLMNEEYIEEAEIATFSDDNVSSHSSVAAVASALEANRCIPTELVENGSTQKTDRDDKEHLARLEKSNMMPQDTCQKLERSSSSTSSSDVSSDLGSPVNGHASSNSTNCNSVTTQKRVVSPNAYSSYPSLAHDKLEADFKIKTRNGSSRHSDEEMHEKVVNHRNTVTDVQMYNKNPGAVNCDVSEVIDKFDGIYEEADKYCVKEEGDCKFYNSYVEDKHGTENYF